MLRIAAVFLAVCSLIAGQEEPKYDLDVGEDQNSGLADTAAVKNEEISESEEYQPNPIVGHEKAVETEERNERLPEYEVSKLRDSEVYEPVRKNKRPIEHEILDNREKTFDSDKPYPAYEEMFKDAKRHDSSAIDSLLKSISNGSPGTSQDEKKIPYADLVSSLLSPGKRQDPEDLHQTEGMKKTKMPYFSFLNTILKNEKMPYSNMLDSVLSQIKVPESFLSRAGAQMMSMPEPEVYVDSFFRFLHRRIGEILWGDNGDPNGKSTLLTFLKLVLQSDEPQNALEALIENGKFIGIVLTLMKDIGEFNRQFLATHRKH